MRYKIRKCEYCGKLAHCKRRFCSLNCYHNWLIGKPTNSKTRFQKGHIPWNKDLKPDKEWYDKMEKAGFFKPKFGENAGNWKGGVTKLGTCIRGLKEYKEWRMRVFIRDNFTCQKCGRKRKAGDRVILQAHHKKPFYQILFENQIKSSLQAIECKELWNIDNGQTLCKKCHKLTDSYLLNQYTIPEIVQLKSPLIDLEAQKWVTGAKALATLND